MRLHGRWFTGKHHKYTFRNLCIEDNEVLLNDATTKLFLSTKGKAEGKIEAIRNAIKDGLTTLAAVKKSGRYTEEEIAAIAAP